MRDAEQPRAAGASSTCSTCTGIPRPAAAASASRRRASAEAVVAARVQAPRSLWDPSYVETSWITQDARAGAIRLLPRMREKIAAHYPGTRLAFTEYNYGGGGHISGAIAQADVLGHLRPRGGVRGRSWDLGGGSRFIDAAFAAYRNYDGALAALRRHARRGGHQRPRDDARSTPASTRRRDDRMVIVAINKATAAHDGRRRGQRTASTSAAARSSGSRLPRPRSCADPRWRRPPATRSASSCRPPASRPWCSSAERRGSTASGAAAAEGGADRAHVGGARAAAATDQPRPGAAATASRARPNRRGSDEPEPRRCRGS